MEIHRGFAGSGPQGYTRSDERVFEDVCEELTHHPELDARWLRVVVRDGVVTIDGRVDTRDTKYLVEDVVAGVRGVRDVENRLKVGFGESAFDPELERGLFGKLIEEHRMIAALFDIAIGSRELDDRRAAFATLARELTLHMRAEEEIVYPALDGSYELGDRIHEARREHERAAARLETLEELGDSGDVWLAKVRALRAEVEHHVREEERAVFPRARMVLDRLHQEELLELYEQDKVVQARRLDRERAARGVEARGAGHGTTSAPNTLHSDTSPPRTVAVEEAHRPRK